jgi:choline-glycine betaine transporter
MKTHPVTTCLPCVCVFFFFFWAFKSEVKKEKRKKKKEVNSEQKIREEMMPAVCQNKSHCPRKLYRATWEMHYKDPN